jgi:hypothetical protein
LPQVGVNQHSPAEVKIALFRSLFRGREDVYPRRFESRKTGRVGYSPACANEWVAGICEKPRIKCSECPHQRFLPVTDKVTRWHLSGRDDQGRGSVMGVYPMLLDESCFFLAADFDKAASQDDAAPLEAWTLGIIEVNNRSARLRGTDERKLRGRGMGVAERPSRRSGFGLYK